jgi:DNA-binding PadR family transcriptional regulator
MSWRLFGENVHCRGVRHERMAELLGIMEANEARGEATSHADFPHASRYRIFYSAERNGLARPIMVPKRRNDGTKEKAYVLTEAGRRWLEGHREFVSRVSGAGPSSPPDGIPAARRGRGRRPGTLMTPVSQLDARNRRRHREAMDRARARMEERRAGRGPV